MDRRTLLALLLTAIVIVLTPMLFPGPRRQPIVDTTHVVAPDSMRAAPVEPARTPPATPTVRAAPPARPASVTSVDTTLVQTNRAIYHIVSPGGTPAAVTLPAYHSLRPGVSASSPVNLIEPNDRLFRLAFAGARDTIFLDSVAFRAEAGHRETDAIVQSFASVGSPAIRLTYRFPVDSFVTHISGAITSPREQRQLLVTLPRRIRSEEANVEDDTRHLAVGYRVGTSGATSTGFSKLDVIPHVETGPLQWIAERNKYFVVAAIPAGNDSAFRAVSLRSLPGTGDEVTAASVTAVLPTGGEFAIRVYAGPQSWEHLRATAPGLENVNPYGGWFHNLVQPFATIVMRLLLWMRHTFDVSYGWVLVLFGIAVRLLTWPLNQSAMRSSMKMQRLQPQLAELQKKYNGQPEKQRDAMMRLYSEHGMSPFSPILGCLPMLLPMPIFLALYFVFGNTIELRGVPFLWLPDLSLKDPFYITPLVMGGTTFLTSWIGMRGMPPSPQSKMMAYVIPVMFTVMFWNFASGLNLYYAVQNLAGIPQQWLLARERASMTASGGSGSGSSASGSGSGSGAKKGTAGKAR